ncbi:hypothetical protein [Pedobacter sp. L105]|uniref:hypothetical protein n=1 Tax=Pedobacter sp. L105 TaxID=1641871 RepID=UPI00131B591D|nr:hypothetical protein [Pedobacter sp. L105]
MTTNNHPTRRAPLLMLLMALFINSIALAQKLPAVQTGGLVLPNVTVDGKSSDWPKDFKAYNKNVNVYYSVGNNDKYLYLLVKATDQLMMRKIIMGGITFSINTAKKEINATSKTVSYPVYQPGAELAVHFDAIINLITNSDHKVVLEDSLNQVINKRLKAKAKEIEVYGFKEIKDTLISVYNEYGIKAAATFDSYRSYTYELAIPLKYFGDALHAGKVFYYNIKLNGYKQPAAPKDGQRPPPPPPVDPGDVVLYSPTDFWAQYKVLL